MPLAA
jgi:hypothetical protein